MGVRVDDGRTNAEARRQLSGAVRGAFPRGLLHSFPAQRALLPSLVARVAKPSSMNKPGRSQPRPLSDLLHKTLTEAFAKQGFASSELVTRWAEIVGAEIAAHSEPEKIQWMRGAHGHT